MPDLAMAIYSVSGNIQRAIAPTDMGTVLYADGTTYRGALLAGGVPQGDGSAKFQDLEYSGAWQAGVRHGEGTLVAPVRRYEGGWVGGAPEHFAQGERRSLGNQGHAEVLPACSSESSAASFLGVV